METDRQDKNAKDEKEEEEMEQGGGGRNCYFFSEFVCLVVKQKVHSSGNTVLPTKSNNRKQGDSK